MNTARDTAASYHCTLDWGRRGVRRAAARGDIVVVVDTLSFSSTTVTAIQRGAVIYPCPEHEELAALAQRVAAEPAVHRTQVPAQGRFSLSPLSFLALEPGTRVALSSPNGATCCRYAGEVPYLFVATLLNARAAARAVAELSAAGALSVTVVACGERLSAADEDGALRFALEDYLGAGAILSQLDCAKSAEARLCESAFAGSKQQLAELIRECESGRELCERGYVGDVRHAAQLNLYDAVPVMRGERLERYAGP